MKFLFTMLMFLFTNSAFGGDYRLVDLQEVSVDSYRILGKRDPYFPEMGLEDWKAGADFIIKADLFKYAYWNNRLHMASDQSQIRHVGLESEFGFHLLPKTFDFYYYHHSQHVTERAPQEFFEGRRHQFPVEDEIGVRLYLFKK